MIHTPMYKCHYFVLETLQKKQKKTLQKKIKNFAKKTKLFNAKINALQKKLYYAGLFQSALATYFRKIEQNSWSGISVITILLNIEIIYQNHHYVQEHL